MSWDKNIYDNPEKFGASIVGEADRSDGGYEWDLFVVWEKDGQLYCGSASGCSCNSPGNEFESLEDLTKATKHEILKMLNDDNVRIEKESKDDWYYGNADHEIRENMQLIEKVMML